MIRHIVLVNFIDNISTDQIQQVGEGFGRLRDRIEVVRAMSWGDDLGLMPGTYDYAMMADFDSVGDWQTYRDHPEHLAFVDRLGALAAGAARVQIRS